MTLCQRIYETCRDLINSNYKPKTGEGMKDEKTLYELSQDSEWRKFWHGWPDKKLALSRIAIMIVSNPEDFSKLAESTLAAKKGKPKPFSISKDTLSYLQEYSTKYSSKLVKSKLAALRGK